MPFKRSTPYASSFLSERSSEFPEFTGQSFTDGAISSFSHVDEGEVWDDESIGVEQNAPQRSFHPFWKKFLNPHIPVTILSDQPIVPSTPQMSWRFRRNAHWLQRNPSPHPTSRAERIYSRGQSRSTSRTRDSSRGSLEEWKTWCCDSAVQNLRQHTDESEKRSS